MATAICKTPLTLLTSQVLFLANQGAPVIKRGTSLASLKREGGTYSGLACAQKSGGFVANRDAPVRGM